MQEFLIFFFLNVYPAMHQLLIRVCRNFVTDVCMAAKLNSSTVLDTGVIREVCHAISLIIPVVFNILTLIRLCRGCGAYLLCGVVTSLIHNILKI